MQSFLEDIFRADFSPKYICQVAKNAVPARRIERKVSFESASRLIDDSGVALPCDASMLVLAVLYIEAIAYGRDGIASAVKNILTDKKAPTLHCEMNSETVVLAELFTQLMDEGAQEKDWKFVAGSRCVSNGVAWYTVSKAHEYMKVADITTALNLEAIRGEMRAFDDRLSSIARPFPGQIDCAHNVRTLVSGSMMTTDEVRYAFGYDTHPRVQDAICVRATPQTHGGARDVCYFAENIVKKAVVDGGSPFSVEYALDGLDTAVADIAHICERRTFRLNDSRLSYGLPMNLTHGNTGINHGYPVVQSNQAALVAELKLLSLPCSVVKKYGECAAYYAGVKLLRGLPLFAKIMAIELLMTCQAMDIVKEKLPSFSFGKGTSAVFGKVRETISVMTENRFVSPDMNEADRLIVSGEVLNAAETAVGALR